MNELEHQTNAHNFVAAGIATTTIEPSIIRRQDVVETTQQMIRAYSDQQKMLISRLQDETVGGRGGWLSDADCLLERRKTSRMYLFAYSFVSALTVGGLAWLAHVAGGVDGLLSLGGWMAGTGGLALWLTWRRHGDEFAHSPEGIARHLLDWHGEIASYESETRRLSLRWEFEAEQRRQAAAAQAAQDARQLAQLRIAEIESRRRAVEAQVERRLWAQDGLHGAISGAEDESIADDAETPVAPSTGDSGRPAQTWQQALLAWVVNLYGDPAAMTEAGVIRQRVLWSARSSWHDADKAAARRICCEMKPALIVPSDGGRWRLRKEMFGDADLALQLLTARLDD